MSIHSRARCADFAFHSRIAKRTFWTLTITLAISIAGLEGIFTCRTTARLFDAFRENRVRANSAAHPEPLKQRALWLPLYCRPGGRER